jgi:hypothetical protein
MPPLRPSWRLQTGALIAAVMTIENYIAFLERVPILHRLGAGALRKLGVNAVGSAAVAASINAAMKGLCWNRRAPKGMMVKNNLEEAQKKWEEKVFTHSRKDRTFESATIS